MKRAHRLFSFSLAMMITATGLGSTVALADVSGQTVTINADRTTDATAGEAVDNSDVHNNKLIINSGNIGVYNSPASSGASAQAGNAL